MPPSTTINTIPSAHVQNKIDMHPENAKKTEVMTVDGNSGQLEVNYEKNVTALYESISNSNWDFALQALKNNPEEARTWVVRYHENENNGIMWRFLPLHSACARKPPESVVSALLVAFPDAANFCDDQGMYPLHYACGNQASSEVIRALLAANPSAARMGDPNGMVPIHYMAQWGPSSIHAIEALIDACPDVRDIQDGEGSTPLDYAKDGDYSERDEMVEALQNRPLPPQSREDKNENQIMNSNWESKNDNAEPNAQNFVYQADSQRLGMTTHSTASTQSLWGNQQERPESTKPNSSSILLNSNNQEDSQQIVTTQSHWNQEKPITRAMTGTPISVPANTVGSRPPSRPPSRLPSKTNSIQRASTPQRSATPTAPQWSNQLDPNRRTNLSQTNSFQRASAPQRSASPTPPQWSNQLDTNRSINLSRTNSFQRSSTPQRSVTPSSPQWGNQLNKTIMTTSSSPPTRGLWERNMQGPVSSTLTQSQPTGWGNQLNNEDLMRTLSMVSGQENTPALAKSLAKLNAEIAKLQAEAAYVEAEMEEKLLNQGEEYERQIEEVRASVLKCEEESITVKTDLLAKEEYTNYVQDRTETAEKDLNERKEENVRLENELNNLTLDYRNEKNVTENLEDEVNELGKSFKVMRQEQEHILANLALVEEDVKNASEARKIKLQAMFDEEMKYSMESVEMKQVNGPNGPTVKDKLEEQKDLMEKCNDFLASSNYL